MKIKKIIMSLMIICALFVVTTTSAFAEPAVQHWNESLALYNLGLFNGTSSTEYSPNLTAPLNRTEGVIFVIKLFGRQHQVHDISLAEVNSILARFHDEDEIPSWARSYVAWAVKEKMIIGTNLTEFSALKPLSGSAYCTMILRELGYPTTSSGEYSAAPLKLETIGAPADATTNGSKIVKFNTPEMLRDGAVGIALNALNAKFKNKKVVVTPAEGDTSAITRPMSLLEYEVNMSAFTAKKAKQELKSFKIIDAGIWASLGV